MKNSGYQLFVTNYGKKDKWLMAGLSWKRSAVKKRSFRAVRSSCSSACDRCC